MTEHFSVHLHPTITNLTWFIPPILLAKCQELRAASSDNNQQKVRLNLFHFFFQNWNVVNKIEYENKYFLYWFVTSASWPSMLKGKGRWDCVCVLSFRQSTSLSTLWSMRWYSLPCSAMPGAQGLELPWFKFPRASLLWLVRVEGRVAAQISGLEMNRKFNFLYSDFQTTLFSSLQSSQFPSALMPPNFEPFGIVPYCVRLTFRSWLLSATKSVIISPYTFYLPGNTQHL